MELDIRAFAVRAAPTAAILGLIATPLPLLFIIFDASAPTGYAPWVIATGLTAVQGVLTMLVVRHVLRMKVARKIGNL